MKNAPKVSLSLLVLFIGSFSGIEITESRTLYVERWGVNSNECGSKSTPCELISYALDEHAGKNDRIVVGPGMYLDNISVNLGADDDPLTGVKIESTGGRNVTIIDAVQNDIPVIDVNQPNVRIGKKGKGFGFTGASMSSGVRFVDSVSERGKVEGNLSFENFTGFDLTGDSIQVRSNIARENADNGFECSECTRARIQNNQAIFNQADGFDIFGSGKIVFQKNRSVRNGGFGYRVGSGGGPEFSGSVKKFLHNLALDNALSGFRMDQPENVAFTGNIAVLNGSDGVAFRNQTGMDFNAPRISKNVSASNGASGLAFSANSMTGGINDIRLDGNHAVDNNQDGIVIRHGIQFLSSKNNNTYNNISGCGIRNEEDVDVTFSKHFMSTAGTPNTVCNDGAGVAAAELVDKPSPVRLSAARQL